MLVSPADYVIRTLGGLTKTANALGIAVTTVQGWKVRGRIPQHHWHRLIELAADDGKKIGLPDFLKKHEVEGAENAA